MKTSPEITSTTPERVIVAVAHPDDEGLVVGAMSSFVKRGAILHAYVATKGRATTRDRIDPVKHSFVRSGKREREGSLALTASNVPYQRQLFTDLPDGGLHRPEIQEEAAAHLSSIMREYGITTVITLGENGVDRHPDHVGMHTVAQLAIQASLETNPISLYGIDIHRPTTRFAVNPATKLRHFSYHQSQNGIDVTNPQYVPRPGTLEVPGIQLDDTTNDLLSQYELFFQQEPYRVEVFNPAPDWSVTPDDRNLARV